MAAPKKVDYERIEPGWRAGIKSPEQLASEYTEVTGIPVSRTAIIKHFKILGIPRDLKAKIQAKADAMVAASLVSGKVSTLSPETERTIIDTVATEVATVRISHRKDIGRSRSLAMKLLDELEAQTAQVPELLHLGELMAKPDDKGLDKLNELYQKIIGLPTRTKTMKDLAETLKTLIGLEREAYGINASTPPADDTEKLTDEELNARIQERFERLDAARAG